MKLLYRTAAAALFLLIMYPAKAQKAGTVERITLEQYMELVKTNLPEIEKNRIAVERASNNVQIASAGDDLTLDGSFEYYGEDRYSSYNTTSDVTGSTASLELNQRLSATGTRLYGGTDYTAETNDGVTAWKPSVYVGVSQPVLKNAFGVADRFAKNDAAMKLEIQKLKKKDSDSSTYSSARLLYINWLAYGGTEEILTDSVTNAKALYESIRRKQQSISADTEDVQNAYSVYLSYRNSYEKNMVSKKSLQGEIALYLDVSKYSPADGELENLFKTAENFSYGSKEFSATNNAEIYRLTKKNLQEAGKVAGNDLLPELNLVGEYRRKSLEDSMSSSYSSMNDSDYFVGFNFSMPLQNSESSGTEKNARLDIEEVNRDYQISSNSYKKSLSYIQESVEGLKKRITIKQEQIVSLNQLYRTRYNKYLQARADLKDLLDTSNSILDARTELVSLKAEMVSLYFDYQTLTE